MYLDIALKLLALFSLYCSSTEAYSKKPERRGCPARCDTTSCQVPPACSRALIRDECGCCLICPPNRNHHPIIDKSLACRKVTCAERKMCVINVQGLPICKCPSYLLCTKGKRAPTCGSDRILYYSPCHKRVRECNKRKKIAVVDPKNCKFFQHKDGSVGRKCSGKKCAKEMLKSRILRIRKRIESLRDRLGQPEASGRLRLLENRLESSRRKLHYFSL